MNFDKHDLFRNALPGYIFLLAVFVINKLSGEQNPLENVNQQFLIFLTGFPIGFIISWLYRYLFHVTLIGCTCQLSEQKRMEKWDADLVRRVVKEPATDFDDKLLSNLLIYSCQKSTNKTFQERCEYLMTHIHSLGASGCAVAFAELFCMVYPFHRKPPSPLSIFVGFVLIVMLMIYRSKIKVSYRVSREIFVSRESFDIHKGYLKLKKLRDYTNQIRIDSV